MSKREDELLALLRECRTMFGVLEFANTGGTDVTSWGECPECRRADWQGHKPNCKLAAFFKRLNAAIGEPS